VDLPVQGPEPGVWITVVGDVRRDAVERAVLVLQHLAPWDGGLDHGAEYNSHVC
jgi:hypothetical protein